ncbi:hypothetical protein RJ639_044856 [Escallonia herrerae]|uniref:NADP-dependent oxidoreductase domain-containing protein n=1 Tax=Escallonia herrerae TaxID=1293975 RepID=A0AA89B791_9ASTE|nr:hypothetical protein RJ639_044856 [Escallonia herrerae]
MATEAQKLEMPRVKLGSQGLEIYGLDYANEILVGKALKHLPREKIQLATKFGYFKIDSTQVVIKGSPEYVRSCCEASLKRLNVDYIDLYYPHRVDTTVPIEDTLVTLLLPSRITDFVLYGRIEKTGGRGQIKYIGLSEPSPDTIRRAHAVHPVTALQMEYSIWTRDIEEEIIPLCRELGFGLVPYSPLGRGFFGGKAVKESLPADSVLGAHPRFTGQNLEQNKIIYTRIEALAKKYGCTPAQLALAWVLHQGDDTVPIPGTTKIKNLDDNVGSVRVKLTESDRKEISDAVPITEVAGSRVSHGSLQVHHQKLASNRLQVKPIKGCPQWFCFSFWRITCLCEGCYVQIKV